MKYIKTNDGIWVYNEIENCAERPNKEMGCTQVWLNFKKECIVKQADTIEELCDEFVVYVKDNIKVIRIFPRGKAMEYSTYLKQTDNLDSEIYGAIWTDKGLIYVAKMNEKGELELL